MLSTRSIPSVCLSCRLRFLASPVPNAQSVPSAQLLRSYRFPTFLGRAVAPRKTFTTTARCTLDARDNATESGNRPERTIEEAVRQARQSFGDVLPQGHLTDEEFVLYERLYGTPVFVDKGKDIQELNGEDAEIFEEKLPDGTSVLLKKGEDGALEGVEILDESEDDIEAGEGSEEEATMTEAEWQTLRETRAETYHQDMYEKSMKVQEQREMEDNQEDDDFMRAHPLTVAGRFKPSPSTVYLPKETLVDPVTELLTRANHKHLAESSNRIFGGPGLPYSATTPAAHLRKVQKPVPLDPSQAELGHIEADAYLAAVMPGTYATVMGALVEVRRRLGTPWIEHLLQKKNGPLILDAGSAGAGVLAWHAVLKAEWTRMHEESNAISHGSTPLGKATVLTGSNTLRHRASRLLENTTFIPRLPSNAAPEKEGNTQQPQKLYDLIIAPHTLWPLKQEYQRKEKVEKYWSLLNPKGGVLVLLEKGLPRGFEVIAGAREYLLDNHIVSPGSSEVETSVDAQLSSPDDETRFVQKETGMIIAPCTNHSTCPMYQSPGVSQGRSDFCFFSQRYIRPPYLQRILDSKDRNHEDVQFSYIAVQRGRDQRLPLHDLTGKGVVQNEDATTQAFEGYEWKAEGEATTSADVNPLSLPRLILPALKRRGHIILDVCTPSGKLERWTVPRSFSKQAFRDARKARWGDLWALGAKTRIPRNVRLGTPRDEFDKKGRRIKAPKKQVIEVGMNEKGFQGMRAKTDGRYAQDRKIRGSGGRKGRKKNYDVMAELE